MVVVGGGPWAAGRIAGDAQAKRAFEPRRLRQAPRAAAADSSSNACGALEGHWPVMRCIVGLAHVSAAVFSLTSSHAFRVELPVASWQHSVADARAHVLQASENEVLDDLAVELRACLRFRFYTCMHGACI